MVIGLFSLKGIITKRDTKTDTTKTEKSVISNMPGTQSISFTESQLETELNKNLPTEFSNLDVEITTETITLKGDYKKGLTTKMEVTGKPVIENEKVGFQIVDSKLAGIKMPEFILKSLNEEIDKNIKKSLNVKEVKGISLEQDKINLTVLE